MHMQNQKESTRIIAIDILKVLAVLTVLNSHMDIAYSDFGFLATGGAIGDALFFFCSGFMLLRGPKAPRFDNFMKRRISRIYPTVIIVAIVGALLFERRENIVEIFLFGGGWFVNCIMIYYCLLWIVKKWCINRLALVWVFFTIITIFVYYFLFEHNDEVSLYGNTYFKWVFFFASMLQGAQIGLTPDKYNYNKYVMPKLLLCVCCWYSFFLFQKQIHLLVEFQYLSIIPLLGITYYLYCLCRASFWKKLYEHRIIGNIIFIIGGLCLECYLIQGFFITDKLNYIFPLNILLIVVFIFAVSYIVNFCSSVFSSTFKNEEYQWRKYLLKKN